MIMTSLHYTHISTFRKSGDTSTVATIMANNLTTNRAVVTNVQGALEEKDIALPVPESHQVLVHISHVAQNPTDVQSFDSKAFGVGAVHGCDFVGEVVALGPSVSRLHKGDLIAGLVWGGEVPGVGAYSQYTLADENICFKVPEGVSREAAATVPLAAATGWLSLFSKQCLNIDSNVVKDVLIWGGSSSVGQYAVQLAKLHSLNVVTTCSPKNFDLVKRLGADHVFDYKSPDVVQQIRSVVPNLAYVFDTIGSTTSSEIASQPIKRWGRLCTVRPGKANTESVASNVEVTDVLVWTAFMKDHKYGKFHWPASADDHSLASELFIRIPKLLQSGELQPNAVLLLKGLGAIKKGFELNRQGKLSAQKIVYEL